MFALEKHFEVLSKVIGQTREQVRPQSIRTPICSTCIFRNVQFTLVSTVCTYIHSDT